MQHSFLSLSQLSGQTFNQKIYAMSVSRNIFRKHILIAFCLKYYDVKYMGDIDNKLFSEWMLSCG